MVRILLACRQFEPASSWAEVLSREPDFEVFSEAGDALGTLMNVASIQADIVVIDLPVSGEDPGLYSHILSEYQEVKIVAASRNGDHVVMYQRGVVRRQVDQVTPANIGSLIRLLASEEDVIGEIVQ